MSVAISQQCISTQCMRKPKTVMQAEVSVFDKLESDVAIAKDCSLKLAWRSSTCLGIDNFLMEHLNLQKSTWSMIYAEDDIA